MDTEQDFIDTSREYFLGATQGGFEKWKAQGNSGTWGDYLDSLENSYYSFKEKIRNAQR